MADGVTFASGIDGVTAVGSASQLQQQLRNAHRRLSMGEIGDSFTVNGQSVLNSHYTAGVTPTPTQIAASYAEVNRCFSWESIRLWGSLYSQGTWFPHEYSAGSSGLTSSQVLAGCLPALLGNPYGLPDFCLVTCGVWDVVNNFGTLTTAQIINLIIGNLTTIYQTLLNNKIIPVAMTMPPNSTDASGVAAVKIAVSDAIIQLGNQMGIPVCDMYSTAANATSTNEGIGWAGPSSGTAVWTGTADHLHATVVGAKILGFPLNKSVQNWLGSYTPRLIKPAYSNANDLSWYQNPHFNSIVSGTVNQAGSVPTGWQAVTSATCMVVTPAGAGVTFSPALGAAATSGTLLAALPGGVYGFTFSDGEYRNVTVGTGFGGGASTAVAWTGALTAGAGITAAQIGEYGVGKTPRVLGPTTFGGQEATAQIPTYVGSTFCMRGNGASVANFSSNTPTFPGNRAGTIAAQTGDKIALSCRLKYITTFDLAVGAPNDLDYAFQDAGNGQFFFGVQALNSVGSMSGIAVAPIGNDPALPAVDLYFEYTLNGGGSGSAGTLYSNSRHLIQISNVGNTSSSANDALMQGNYYLMNLTQGGILSLFP